MRECKNCGERLASVNVTFGDGRFRNALYHLESADTFCHHGRSQAQVRYEGRP